MSCLIKFHLANTCYQMSAPALWDFLSTKLLALLKDTSFLQVKLFWISWDNLLIWYFCFKACWPHFIYFSTIVILFSVLLPRGANLGRALQKAIGLFNTCFTRPHTRRLMLTFASGYENTYYHSSELEESLEELKKMNIHSFVFTKKLTSDLKKWATNPHDVYPVTSLSLRYLCTTLPKCKYIFYLL